MQSALRAPSVAKDAETGKVVSFVSAANTESLSLDNRVHSAGRGVVAVARYCRIREGTRIRNHDPSSILDAEMVAC